MLLTLAPGASARLPGSSAAGEHRAARRPGRGLKPREHEKRDRNGVTAVRLGPRVLRTEPCSRRLGRMQTLWGDF